MNNSDFLKKYLQFQNSVTFDELIDLGFALIGYSKVDTSEYWNMALISEPISDDQLEEVESFFISINRRKTFYFETKKEVVKALENKGYKKSYEDTWQFYENSEVENKGFEFVKKVKDENDLLVFLKTIESCYQKDDPQNPYGELGDYLKVAEEGWRKHNKTDRLEYFIVYKGDKPVAVATLNNFEGVGYISNVGSLREVRGQGYGKIATLYCVNQSIKNGNKIHCLTTEEGAYPFEFYKRIGFVKKFSALGYTKNI